MIYQQLFLDFLKDKNSLCRIVASGKEIMTYCPFCEGKTGKKHGHLYISTEEPLFYCHRCGEKGNLVKLLAFFETDFSLFDIILDEYKDRIAKIELKRTFSDFSNVLEVNEFNYDLTQLTEGSVVFTKETEKKVEYLANRLNIGSIREIEKIPGLILKMNDKLKQKLSTRYSGDLINLLDQGYVGFISRFGGKCVFRRIHDDNNNTFGHNRYYTLKLFDLPFNDVYVIHSKEKTEKTPTFVLSEGVFDIICAYQNSDVLMNFFIKYQLDPVIWVSVLGKSYYYTSISLLCAIKRCTMCNLCILSDSDVTLGYYRNLLDYPFVEKVVVLYCNNSKDFGTKYIRKDDVLSYVLTTSNSQQKRKRI